MNYKKNHLRKKKIPISVFSILLIFSLLSLININHAQEIKIRVSVNKANVRLNSSHSSPVISVATAGITAQVIRKIGEWYFVELPPNEKGYAIAGYIHQNAVEEIKIKEPIVKERADQSTEKEKSEAESIERKEIKAKEKEQVHAEATKKTKVKPKSAEKEELPSKEKKTATKMRGDQEIQSEFVITDELFEPWDKVDCTTHVAISGYENGSFKVGTKNIEGGEISIRNGNLILWGYGARHTWIGRVAYEGYIFQSDEDNPLQFKIIKDEGYKYIKGKGTITFPNGETIFLQIYKDKEVKAEEEKLSSGKFDLLWKFQIGHPYRIHSISTTQSVTTTQTQGNQQKEKETEKQEITFLLTPKKKLENGHYEIILDYKSLKKENVSKDITIHLEGEESEEEQPKINVEVTGGSPELRSEEYKNILRKIISNILETTVEMEVSPAGNVISMDIKKSPYDNLPAHTEFGRMVVDMVKDMITKEDLTSSIAAEMFIQLPSEQVAINEDWPVKREFHLMGIHMDGSGRAVLQEVQNIDGKPTAVILEEVNYKVNTDEFNQKIEDMMKTIGKQSGISISANSNIEAFEQPVFNSKTEFNIQKGIIGQTKWDNQTLKIGGILKLTARGNTSEVEMDTVITVNSKVTWK